MGAWSADKLREHRRRLREAGICTRCHRRPHAEGFAYCTECRGIERKWREAGTCDECGSRPAKADLSRCEPCLKRLRARRRVEAKERKARGVCVYCGRPKPPGWKVCTRCTEYHRRDKVMRRMEWRRS